MYVDLAVERILNIVFRYTENAKPETPWDMEADHLLAADIRENGLTDFDEALQETQGENVDDRK